MSRVLKDVSYTTVANAAALFVSTVVTLGVPKLLGLQEYGFFQLYLFYTGYVGFMHFGWIDGIYLRYGGVRYPDLDRSVLSGQFRLYAAIEIVLGAAVCLAAALLAPQSEKSTVLLLTGACIGVHLPRSFFVYILQCTGRIREYSTNLLLDRVVFLVLVGTVLTTGSRSFALLALADLIAKAVGLVHAGWYCRDIVKAPPTGIRESVVEAGRNIGVGLSLMFANIAGLLIIGLVRFGISDQWDVATFGKVSLTLSVSNLLMVFVGAVGMVLFPIICRLPGERLTATYSAMRAPLLAMLMSVLLVYYPLRAVLSTWLPKYAEALRYMAILLPLAIYQSKMSLMVGTFLKAIREERWLLRINLITVVLSAGAVTLSCYVWRNLDLAILSMVLLMAIRSDLGELVLAQAISVKVRVSILIEALLVIVFIGSSWLVGGVLGFFVYLVALAAYLLVVRGRVADAKVHLTALEAGD